MAARPRRLTANQAMALFDELAGENSDLELETDSEFDSESSEESDSGDSRSSGSANASFIGPSTSGQQSADRGGVAERPAKRPRLETVREDRSRSSVSNRGDNNRNSDWKRVHGGQVERTVVEHQLPLLTKDRRPAGVNPDLHVGASPYECYSMLFDDEIMTTLIQSINEFASYKMRINNPAKKRSRLPGWHDLDMYELFRFMAVTMTMGIDKRPSVRDYFSKHPALHTPFFSKMFTNRERFEMLYSTTLHVSAPDAEGKAKIEPFANKLIDKFNHAFVPFENVSIDEMIIGWKGRWKYKQFNASKPHKYHIKSFGLVDSSTGYVVNLLTYYGSETSYDPSRDYATGSNAVKIFDTLLKAVGTGHHIFADRWYTTRLLVDHLIERGYNYTGTLQINRTGFPQDLKSLKLAHLQSQYWTSKDDNILCSAWKDKKAKKPVILVSTSSTADNVTRKGKEKPAIVDTYNMNMNGCDKADQMVGYYGLHTRRTRKWWKKIFFWLVEIVCVNAHILHTLTRPDGEKPVGLKIFKLTLIEDFCRMAATIMPPAHQLSPAAVGRPRSNPVERLQGTKHLIVYTDKDRRCQVCSTPQKKIRTNFICEGCEGQPHLHPKECFKKWHSRDYQE